MDWEGSADENGYAATCHRIEDEIFKRVGDRTQAPDLRMGFQKPAVPEPSGESFKDETNPVGGPNQPAKAYRTLRISFMSPDFTLETLLYFLYCRLLKLPAARIPLLRAAVYGIHQRDFRIGLFPQATDFCVGKRVPRRPSPPRWRSHGL